MKRWTRFVYCCGVLGTVACGTSNPTAPSQSPPRQPPNVSIPTSSYTLHGYVHDGSNSLRPPIAGARVSLWAGEIGSTYRFYQATTDSSGYYRIEGLAGVVCDLEVAKDGYQGVWTEFSLTGKETRVDFDLKRQY